MQTDNLIVTLLAELPTLHAQATEPYPTPMPDTGSRVGEVGAALEDKRAREDWIERTEKAASELTERVPAIIAILRAVREPSEAMIKAGLQAPWTKQERGYQQHPREVFTAMIDSIIVSIEGGA